MGDASQLITAIAALITALAALTGAVSVLLRAMGRQRVTAAEEATRLTRGHGRDLSRAEPPPRHRHRADAHPDSRQRALERGEAGRELARDAAEIARDAQQLARDTAVEQHFRRLDEITADDRDPTTGGQRDA